MKYLISFFIFVSCVYASDINHNEIINQKIIKMLDANRIKYHLPGISLSIKLPDSKTQNFVSGYYTLSQTKKITPETLFQMGSITKTFTSTIIFKLIDENKLSLNEKVGRFLPQYPKWKNISIANLLHHTSGIYNYTSGSYLDTLMKTSPGKYRTLSDLADIAYKQKDIFKSGTKYHYSNTDYILLGMIIEHVSHESMDKVFNDYFKQYDLKNTFYSPHGLSSEMNHRIAHGYNRDGTFDFNLDVTYISTSYWQSAGAIISTPEDIVKWLDELFNGKILSQKSLKEMTKIISEQNLKLIKMNEVSAQAKLHPPKEFEEIGAGDGIGAVYFKNNGITYVHAGGTAGYESFYAYSPCSEVYLALAYNVKPPIQMRSAIHG